MPGNLGFGGVYPVRIFSSLKYSAMKFWMGTCMHKHSIILWQGNLF
jgi:hypothetical protein